MRKGAYVERLRWPYRLAGIAAAAAYVFTTMRSSMPLVLFGGCGSILVLWAVSGRIVNIDANRGRQWVARELAFVVPTSGSEYRSADGAELVVDGEQVGRPSAVLLVRWEDYDHFSRISSSQYEVAIATQRRVFVVDEGPLEKPVRALAEHIVKSLGSTIPLTERTRSMLRSPELLWAATLVPALAATPLEMPPARRGLLIVAVLIVLLANVVSISVRTAARAPDRLRTIYGVGDPALHTHEPLLRYVLAFSLAAHALLWTSILWPGGPHVAIP